MIMEKIKLACACLWVLEVRKLVVLIVWCPQAVIWLSLQSEW